MTPLPVSILAFQRHTTISKGFGDIVLNFANHETSVITEVSLRRAWYIPTFTHNLISSSHLAEDSDIESSLGKNYGSWRKEGESHVLIRRE